MSRRASLRMLKRTPSFSANAALAHGLSTLMPRITVLFELNWPEVSWYFAISLVHPGEKAAGKKARTTFFWPLNSLSVTGVPWRRPLASGGARYLAGKSGATCPTLTLGGGGALAGAWALAGLAASTHAANARTKTPVI